jgi:hypothetical protein
MHRFLCGACRGRTDANDGVRSGLGQCHRDFGKLVITEFKAINHYV